MSEDGRFSLLYPDKSTGIAGPWGFDYFTAVESDNWQVEEIDRATFLAWAYKSRVRHVVIHTDTDHYEIDLPLAFGSPESPEYITHVLSCIVGDDGVPYFVHAASTLININSYPFFYWRTDPTLPETTFYFLEQFFMERVIIGGEEKFFIAALRYPESGNFVSTTITADENTVTIVNEFTDGTRTNTHTIAETHFD